MLTSITIQTADFNLAERYAAMREVLGAQIGAMCAFVGLVRERNALAGDGHEVAVLRLEHYPGMTENSIGEIVAQAQQRWPLLGVDIVHRVGDLVPEDQIVMVLTASAHREAAFAAAEFVMDYLKTDAVLWKKETTAAGERWLESTDADKGRRTSWDAPDDNP